MALQHLRSSTANKRPDPTAMAEGQLALNTANASPGLFYKDATGSLIKSGPVHIGATAPNATPAAGGHAGNSVGEAWLDTSGTNPLLKIYNGAAFVTVQPVASGTVVSTADTGTVTSTMILDGTILNADINASAAIVDTKLATIATGGKVSNSATTATNANTASAIVARDASGNFTAGTITAALTGAASSNVLKAGDTMTGALVHPLGAAATPSLTFTGDLDTGVFSPGANQLAVATNGVERVKFGTTATEVVFNDGGVDYDFRVESDLESQLFFIDASDNSIGVGTAGNYKNGAILVAALDRADGAGTANVRLGISVKELTSGLDRGLWFGARTDENTGVIGTRTASGNLAFETYNGFWSEKMRLTYNGRLGIGSTNPGQALEVLGTIYSQNNATTIVHFQAADTGAATNEKTWRVAQSFRSTKALGLGVAVNDASSVANAAITIVRSGATLDNIQFATGSGTERARIDSSGRLGIGTSSPGATLSVLSAASASIPAIQFSSSGSLANNEVVRFQINGLTNGFRMFQDASSNVRYSFEGGSVGIGTTGPGHALQVNGAICATGAFATASANTCTLDASSGRGRVIVSGPDASTYSSLAFGRLYSDGSGYTETARFDASGRLLVGTSSARANMFNATLSSAFQVEGTTHNTSSVSIVRNSNDVSAAAFVLGKSRGAAVGSSTLVNNNDTIAYLSFQGADGSELVECASIACEVDGTPGANDMPGRLEFSTTADGASSPTERMRILSTGSVLFSTDTEASITSATANGHMWYESTQSWASSRSTTGGASHFVFYNPNGVVGTIQTSASATSYNTSSDYRLKENVTAVTDGITRLQQLKPSRFNFIADPAKTVDGFLAHEVQTIVPEAITGEKDAVDDEGNPVYQGIDQSKLVPLLTAALQEAVAKIESLEARLTAAGI